MVNWTAQQVIKEMRSHPVTLLLVLILMGIAAWGWSNFARAADLETIKAELRSEISTLSSRIIANNNKIDRGYKLQLAESIRGLQWQICEADDRTVKEGLLNTLEALQEDYKGVNDGNEYPLQRCQT